MNGMRCTMSPLMKWTSLESLSSFPTAIEHLRFRAILRALASCGRSSSASAPLSVSISVNSAIIWSPFACAKRSNASRWASSPRPNPFFPDRACFCGANSIVGNDRLHGGASGWPETYFNPLVVFVGPAKVDAFGKYVIANTAGLGPSHATLTTRPSTSSAAAPAGSNSEICSLMRSPCATA